MDSILVTGGCGFIGAHLVDRLVRLKHRVLVLDNLSTGIKEALPDEVEFIYADAGDKATLKHVLPKVDCCVHLAAIASVQAVERNWHKAHLSNFMPLLNILNVIKDNALKTKIIFSSSSAVYGNSKELLSEEMRPQPLSLYGVDKLGCESLANAICVTNNIPTINLRLFNVFGCGQNKDSQYSGVITTFKENLEQKRPLVIYGDGKQRRDFIYINDIVDAIFCAMKFISTQQGTFNICSGKSVTLLELAHLMMSLSEVDVPIKHEKSRINDIHYSVGNGTKAEEYLNFKVKTSLRDGLKKMLYPARTITGIS